MFTSTHMHVLRYSGGVQLFKRKWLHLRASECTNTMSARMYQSVRFWELFAFYSLRRQAGVMSPVSAQSKQIGDNKTFGTLRGSLRRILLQNRPLRIVDDKKTAAVFQHYRYPNTCNLLNYTFRQDEEWQ